NNMLRPTILMKVVLSAMLEPVTSTERSPGRMLLGTPPGISGWMPSTMDMRASSFHSGRQLWPMWSSHEATAILAISPPAKPNDDAHARAGTPPGPATVADVFQPRGHRNTRIQPADQPEAGGHPAAHPHEALEDMVAHQHVDQQQRLDHVRYFGSHRYVRGAQ